MIESLRCNQGSRNCSTIHTDKGTGRPPRSLVNCARDQLLACARFTREQNSGIRRRNLGHARKHCSQGGRDPYNLFKHEGLIDLLPERHVLVLKAVFQILDFFESFFQFGPSFFDLSIVSGVLYRDCYLVRHLRKKPNIDSTERMVLAAAKRQYTENAIPANKWQDTACFETLGNGRLIL